MSPNPNPRTIDVNADLGEGAPNDEALLDRVTSACVCCGAHAGDRATIVATLRGALARGVGVGAHPGYPDREGFGRRERRASAAEVERLIVEQVHTLRALAAEVGLPIRFLKPHGALYNQAQRDAEIARGLLDAVETLGLPLLGQPLSLLFAGAVERGLSYVSEGFPDRRYRPDGRLVPRSEPDALLHDPAEFHDQVARLLEQGVGTLCLHGDDPRAVANADMLRESLRRLGVVPSGAF